SSSHGRRSVGNCREDLDGWMICGTFVAHPGSAGILACAATDKAPLRHVTPRRQGCLRHWFIHKFSKMLFAALPLDVREVCNLPAMIPTIFPGYATSTIRGVAQKGIAQ